MGVPLPREGEGSGLISRDVSTAKMSRARNKRRRESEHASAAEPSAEKGATRAKKSRRVEGTSDNISKSVSHPLLSQLYPQVQTLRDYVLSKLPASSRLRRKKIASLGLASEASGKEAVSETEQNVARLLDTTVVASSTQSNAPEDDRWEKWSSFSQKGDESYVTLSDGFTGASFSQTEVHTLPRST